MSAPAPKDAGEALRAHGANGLHEHVRNNARPFEPQANQSGDKRKLPPIKSARKLVDENLALPPVIVHGLLHQGSKMVLGGGSKSFKTWCLADLALSVANGVPWWDINTNKGRVLYMNYEIQEGFFAKRLESIATAKGMGTDALEHVDTWNLRGFCADLSDLITSLLEKIKKDHYSLIVVDPIYKVLGGRDENSAGEIGKLLNEVEKLAVQTGAAVVFGAHFTKGNQAGKESIDRISGSGVFARDPDTILTMTKHESEYTYTVDSTLRNFAPMDPFCVKWLHPLMQRDAKADPRKLKVPGKKVETHTVQHLLDILGEQELTTTSWYQQVSHQTGMSKSTFMDKLKKIKDDENILTKTDDDRWKAVNPVKKEEVGPEVR